MGSRLRAIAYWTTAPLLLIALYWRGLLVWFQKDDFAWLGLRGMVHNPRDLAWALFAPLAQGTMRTLSERAENLIITSIFGMNPLPFRILGFVTCFAALCLLIAVTRELTGSAAAGFLAAILWCLNGVLAVPLAWTAVYYEIAWPFWLLMMIWLLLRGRLVWLWIAFTLGFLILELNVVFPAIACAYALCSGRRDLLKKIVPMFALSILYTAIHFHYAPLQTSGPYKMYWDTRIFSTLVQYWGWALGPGQGRLIGIVSTAIRSTLVWSMTLGLAAFLIARRKNKIVWFFPLWFLIALGPLLPLRDHITSEYLMAPTLGLAMWAGWAMASARREIAAVFFIAYVAVAIPLGQAGVRSFYDRSLRLKAFIFSVADIARAHPGKTILLEGVNSEMFEDALYHRPFRLFVDNEVFMVPQNRALLAIPPYYVDLDTFFREPNDASIVLDVSTGTARTADNFPTNSVR